MEERKLNLNAPFLSVRRISPAQASSNGVKAKKNVISLQNSRRTRTAPLRKPEEVCLDQVTKPVAVPFVWEQIPGKCKDSVSLELQPSEEGSVTPRLPPGRVTDIVRYPSGKEVIDRSTCTPQTLRCIQNDHEAKLDHPNVGNEAYGLESQNDEEVYSDALDTLSPTEAASLNYSVSVLSGSDRALVKPLGTFSSDTQTRDFMMSRFLPAAKAMTLEPPQYASRKQPLAPDQPRQVNSMVLQEVRPPQNQCQAIIVPHYDLKLEDETEDEEGHSECDVTPSNISRKACGLLPRLCFKNSLCLLNPLPGLKVRAHSSKPSTADVRKPSSKEFQRQMIKQHSLDIHNRKSVSVAQYPQLPETKVKPFYPANRLTKSGELQTTNRAQSLNLLEIRNKPLYSASRFTKSGELQITSRSQSPKLSEMGNKPLYSASRLTKSGELQITNRAQSPKLPEIRTKPLYGESRLTKSGELQLANSSSPSGLAVSGRISPYRRERPQSPFKGGGLLGFPKEAENFRTSMLNKYNWTGIKSYSNELVSNRSSKQGSGSASPVVEKTLYIDNANPIEAASSPNSSSADMMGRNGSVGKDSETVSGTKVINKISSPQSSFEYKKCSNVILKEEMLLEQRASWPIVPYQSSSSHLSKLGGQAEKKSYAMAEEVNQEPKLLEYPEATNRDINSDGGSKVDDERDAKADYEPAPLPPPLPKVPSESWLWRTLSTVTSQGSFTQSRLDAQHGTKKQDPKPPATSTKWETIVKTSHLHHDHVRYSEELTSHVSKHLKN